MTGVEPTAVTQASYIDGTWRSTDDSYRVLDPATDAFVGMAPRATVSDVGSAVAAAATALPGWASTTLAERCDALARMARAVDAHRAELSKLVVAETGALAWFAEHVKVAFLHDRLAWHAAAEPSWLESTLTVPMPDGGERATQVIRQPVGVVACITPYNFQLPNVAAKMGAALVAGCTVVVKPAPQDPLSTIRLFEIIDGILPPGVANLIVSDRVEVSEALVEHPAIDMVSFTGSTRVGTSIAQATAGQLKRLLLELGGKSALIVSDDADVPAAARAAASTWTVYAGQICTAPTRVLVHRAQHQALIDELRGIADTLVVGDPREPATHVTPLISATHRERVLDHIASGLDDGALLVTGDAAVPTVGNFVAPTLFDRVQPGMRIAREEIFGPVVCVMPVDSDEHAIAVANDSPYGLDGYVWAGTAERATAIARRLRTGHVSVNGAPMNYEAPFGGFRMSGIGRDRGVAGVHAYTETQSIDLPS
ncbi:MAG: aldehyde dehydrogenase family protein [Ilumatobacteraceae bacterium]